MLLDEGVKQKMEYSCRFLCPCKLSTLNIISQKLGLGGAPVGATLIGKEELCTHRIQSTQCHIGALGAVGWET